jgi:hypothetical protein
MATGLELATSGSTVQLMRVRPANLAAILADIGKALSRLSALANTSKFI